jgi:hypothetical protein
MYTGKTGMLSHLLRLFIIVYLQNYLSTSVVPKVGGIAPWGAVGLPRWALIGTRGGRERCYYHGGGGGAQVEK